MTANVEQSNTISLDWLDTRKVLWTQHSDELYKAQIIEQEAEEYEKMAKAGRAMAAKIRAKAEQFKKAAEGLGTLDDPK